MVLSSPMTVLSWDPFKEKVPGATFMVPGARVCPKKAINDFFFGK
jgi:hypothetical protein